MQNVTALLRAVAFEYSANVLSTESSVMIVQSRYLPCPYPTAKDIELENRFIRHVCKYAMKLPRTFVSSGFGIYSEKKNVVINGSRQESSTCFVRVLPLFCFKLKVG